MAGKSSRTPSVDSQSGQSENHNDRMTMADPNGMGPSMRSAYSEFASAASYYADGHDCPAPRTKLNSDEGYEGTDLE